MSRTVHRGADRGLTPQESRRLGATRAAATRARLKALVDSGVRPEIVKAGWDLVKGRKVRTREAWFLMHETQDVRMARQYQTIVLESLRLPTVQVVDWRSEEWMWGWY